MTERRLADSPPSKLPRLSGADAYDGRGVSSSKSSFFLHSVSGRGLVIDVSCSCVSLGAVTVAAPATAQLGLGLGLGVGGSRSDSSGPNEIRIRRWLKRKRLAARELARADKRRGPAGSSL